MDVALYVTQAGLVIVHIFNLFMIEVNKIAFQYMFHRLLVGLDYLLIRAESSSASGLSALAPMYGSRKDSGRFMVAEYAKTPVS